MPAYDLTTGKYVPVQQKCWRWDPGNDWPPFSAHRDLYFPRDRCSGDRSRDIMWEGGFRQSLVAKNAFDPHYQNNNDCPWKARLSVDTPNMVEYVTRRSRREDGAYCSDGGLASTRCRSWAGWGPLEAGLCELGTNMESCGIRKNLVVFGFAFLQIFEPVKTYHEGPAFAYSIATDGLGTRKALVSFSQWRIVKRGANKQVGPAVGANTTSMLRRGPRGIHA